MCWVGRPITTVPQESGQVPASGRHPESGRGVGGVGKHSSVLAAVRWPSPRTSGRGCCSLTGTYRMWVHRPLGWVVRMCLCLSPGLSGPDVSRPASPCGLRHLPETGWVVSLTRPGQEGGMSPAGLLQQEHRAVPQPLPRSHLLDPEAIRSSPFLPPEEELWDL